MVNDDSINTADLDRGLGHDSDQKLRNGGGLLFRVLFKHHQLFAYEKVSEGLHETR